MLTVRTFFAAVSVCGVALACGGGGATENVGASEAALNTNDKAAFDFFVAKGLSGFQAAGIVGNLDQESNVDPMAVQSGGPGRGIAQWSTGGRWDTDNNDNAVAYAKSQGESVWALQLQLEFIWYELSTFSGYGLSSLEKTTNVTDATVVFETDFEGCGTCDQTNRITYAKNVLAAYGSIPYGAQFVSQSFPLATSTLTMTEGEVIPSYIELKNTGTKSWDSNTRIGTTQPRDRSSAFADSSWLAPNRLAAVKGTVAPGATYKFTFNLAANAPGTYDEFFGVVEEGVAWFSDSGQGGPADSDLEVKIVVVKGDAGAGGDAGAPHEDAGMVTTSDAAGDATTPSTTSSSGGCSVARTPAKPGDFAFVVGVAIVIAIARRRRQPHIMCSSQRIA